MKVHLVDGTYELFRAYYGAPSVRTAAGAEVGASRALLRSLTALLQTPHVTHVAVAFDTVIESFRNRLFAGYKTGEGIEPNLYAQFELAEQVTAALGLVVWSMVEFEADDAIATAAARLAADPQIEQVVICSPDKDFGQCVQGERVVLHDRMRRLVLGEPQIIAKFGVAPASIADWLALVGDAADGIPGVPRWGAKSAAAVLAHYRHIEAIPDQSTAWPVKVRAAAALADSLRTHRQEALLYKQLATLRLDVPLAEALHDLQWQAPPRKALQALGPDITSNEFCDRFYQWVASIKK